MAQNKKKIKPIDQTIDEVADAVVKKPLRAICGTPNKLIDIGGIAIECYVLEGGKRVLSGRGMQTAIGLDHVPVHSKKLGQPHGGKLRQFIQQDNIQPYISDELNEAISNPVYFIRPGRGGRRAIAFEATLIIDLCKAIIESYNMGDLDNNSIKLFEQAQAITLAYAKTGIIAVIDEITGYQDIRAKDALAKIFEKFIAKELQAWTKTFPDEFYKEIFRLKGWEWVNFNVKRPSVIGHYTNDIVYKRIAPSLLKELKKRNPVKPETGKRQNTHHQLLTPDYGHPKLKEHLAGVIALMKVADSWEAFKKNLNKAYPAYNETIEMFG